MSDDPPHNAPYHERTADGSAGCTGDGDSEPPIGRVFHRVMRAVMFDDPPDPELDSLPLAQLRLLWTVFYRTDATMKDFSECLGVSQSTVTQLADRLVRRGLVERKTDPSDRRVVRLHVSKIGGQLLDEATERQHETFREIWAHIMAEERHVALRGLEILADAAETVRSEQGRNVYQLSRHTEPQSRVSTPGGEPSQPVVDLMARRVRGKK
jgi:DNA-binding MarR family transcriptional regulator